MLQVGQDNSITGLTLTACITWSDGTFIPPSIRIFTVAQLLNTLPSGVDIGRGVQLASQNLKTIDVDILEGDTLMFPNDLALSDGCAADVAAESFSQIVASSVRPIAVLGPVCSASALALFPQATQAQIPIVSPDSTSPVLNDQTQFPYLLRLYPSDEFEIESMVSLVGHFGWQRLAIICTNDLYSLGGATQIAERLLAAGITSLPLQPFTGGATVSAILPYVKQLKQSDIRVIVLWLHAADFQTFAEAALIVGLYGKGYAWITEDNSITEMFTNASLVRAVCCLRLEFS